MRRYPHMLTSVSEGRWPDLVVCVDCRSTSETVDEKRTVEVEKLQSWSTSVLSLWHGIYKHLGIGGGSSQSEWWDILASECERYNNIWIVSYQCSRMWSLLGLWDQLETGNVCIRRRQEKGPRGHLLQVRALRQGQADPLGPVSAGAVSRLLDRDQGLLVTEDIPSIASFYYGDRNHRVTWVDTRNYGVESVSESLPGSGRAASIARWFVDYTGLLRQRRLGAPKTTAGSQAYHGFRYGYYTGGVYCHVHRRAGQIESNSYHGGRCEVFRIGHINGPCYHLDVRSMYPAICSSTRLPTRLLYCTDRFSAVEYARVNAGQGCVAEVTIATQRPDYPRSKDGLTIWPIGRFRVSLAGPELADAVSHGRVVAWHGACVYQLEPVLKGYADALYEARCEAETDCYKALAESVKKLLVSLPGKFAQRSRLWVNAPHVGPAIWWGVWYGTDEAGWPCRYRSLGGIVQRDTDMGLGGEANPAIASWITSAGRMLLLSAIRTAGWDEVYYCDTDSLILTERGYDRLGASGAIEPRTMGRWQLKEVITAGEICGIKHYVHNGSVCCAGLPRIIVEKTESGARYWQRDTPSWQVQSRGKPSATRRLVTKLVPVEYRHGIVGPDGRVTPHRIQED